MIFIKVKKFIVVALAVLSVVVSSCVSAFAADDNLTYDQVVSKYNIDYDKSTYPYYVLIKSTHVSYDKYVLVVSKFASAVDVKNGFAFADNGISFYCTTYPDGTITCNQANNSTNSSLGRLIQLNFVSSNYDVKYEGSGDVFFQQPTLLSKLLSLTPSQVGEKVVGDMAILMVCGIGCLALLISLPVLLKTLHKFLN